MQMEAHALKTLEMLYFATVWSVSVDQPVPPLHVRMEALVMVKWLLEL